MPLTLLVVLSLVSYRVTRLIVLDHLFDGARETVVAKWILRCGDMAYLPFALADETRPLWRRKLATLLTCQFCSSAYVSAGAVTITDAYTSVPLPVWAWLAVWSGGLLAWRIIETPDAE